jgi:hypothetical protein
MVIGRVYAISCFTIVAVVLVGFGYLMLFNPSLYVDIRNWHLRKSGFDERFTIKRSSRLRDRAIGLILFVFGVLMSYFAIRSIFH